VPENRKPSDRADLTMANSKLARLVARLNRFSLHAALTNLDNP
jgi:hypothetical protein